MDLSAQIKKLFKPVERPHPVNAELSVREGYAESAKDFDWLAHNIPCRKACPAETDISAYLAAIAENRTEEAYRINLIDNIFPAILGRVCSRPCEAACRHGYSGLGEPVAICFSKRSAADLRQQAPVLLDPHFPPTGKRIAVVGAGVAGLAAARNLALLGHSITVYEKHRCPGGMLNQGIPEFRLPRHLIDLEITQITGLGVSIVCSTAIGADLPLNKLLADFDAVIAAAGTLQSHLPDLPGRHLHGIRHGLDFLLEANKGGTIVGKHILVIGGGFTAMDCARTARRLGGRVAELNNGQLKVLYRRARTDMRTTPGELDELENEGIRLECGAAPVACLEQDGKLSGMRFQRNETGEPFDLPADTILFATGQRPGTAWQEGCEQHPKLFLAGDYATGATTLIDAIAHAKKAAEEVDLFLMGYRRLQQSMHVETAAATGRTREMDEIPRQAMPALPLSARRCNAEVEQGYSTDTATEEAKRCYRCNFKFEIEQDKCIRCDWCLKAKPRPGCILMLKSIKHNEAGKVITYEAADHVREMNLIWINPDECIRCGACIKACPVDAISLQKITLENRPVQQQTEH